MAKSLVETLRKTTAEGVKVKQQRQTTAQDEQVAAEKRAARSQKRKVAKFVAERLDTEIELLTDRAQSPAEEGESSADTVWRIDRGARDPEPTEELAKYRGLRDAVAKHFTELHFTVDLIDNRDSYTDRSGPSDEGYWPPTYTDHLVGVVLYWGEDHEQQD